MRCTTATSEGGWWGIGMGAGIAIGVSTHQLALWIALGAAMALGLSNAARLAREKRNTQ